MSNSTRRPATAADLTKGSLVYKGKGNTLYRVAKSNINAAGVTYAIVVKSTTATDPKRGCWYPMSDYTVEA